MKLPMPATWIDRLGGLIAPQWALRRERARVALDTLRRNYEGAGTGRRQQGWRRTAGDANATIGPALSALRTTARDLVRNNPYAESALATIADHTVGWGIVAKPSPKTTRVLQAWKAWAETTACDADGRHDFYGLQKLVMRTVVESGEVLVRRRLRRPEDGLPLPLQLQVLDPDFLDTSKDTMGGAGPSNRIIQGVEFDAIGRRVAYWLFPEHPGSSLATNASVRVPADLVLHVFKPLRPGQVRGPSWFAPVLLRFKDFDEFEDATLMKQKIAACLAVITSDVDGSSAALGTPDDTLDPPVDTLEPGAILNVPPGRTIDVVQPPAVREYSDYARNVLRAIATGLGVTYEDLTGDYSDMPFSAARMSRLRHEARIHDWRWRILIPQFCDPVWAWFAQAAAVMGQVPEGVRVEWTPPPIPMVDPSNEGLAEMRNVRAGLKSLPEMMRERGYDPDELVEEVAAFNQKLDDLGVVLDSDPRKMTQAGQLQGEAAQASEPAPEPVVTAGRAWRR
jgi:lambda family phage portal protein